MSHTLPRVLLVEDDLTLANLYKQRLEIEGFEVEHCPDGEKALQAVNEFKPHAILLDIMMPRLSGFDVLDIIRNTPGTKTIKIIVLSALSQPADIEKAKALGADDYLIKSQVLLDDVVVKLRGHLNLPAHPAETKK